MNKIPLTVLEYNEGTFEGNPYASVIARYNGKLLKFKLDVKKVTGLQKFVDKDILATLEIVPGDRMAATLKVVAVEPAK